MSYFLTLFLGFCLGCCVMWVVHDPAGAKQLLQDFRDFVQRKKESP